MLISCEPGCVDDEGSDEHVCYLLSVCTLSAHVLLSNMLACYLY
jgi:hypothetical protein